VQDTVLLGDSCNGFLLYKIGCSFAAHDDARRRLGMECTRAAAWLGFCPAPLGARAPLAAGASHVSLFVRVSVRAVLTGRT
jgi:hypothetical protein